MAEKTSKTSEDANNSETVSDVSDKVQSTLDKFLETADVNKAYGEPVKEGDATIIPTAEVMTMMGFGLGGGSGVENERSSGTGSGGGGGGRTLSRPVAVVIATPEGVRVDPVIDITKIVLAGTTALGFMFTTMMRMNSRRRAFKAE